MQLRPNSADRSFRERFQEARFVALTLVAFVVTAAAGAMLVYVAYRVVLDGEFSSRRFGVSLRVETDPVAFYVIVLFELVVGLTFFVGSPLLLTFLLRSPSQRRSIESLLPNTYGRVRPSLWFLLLVVGAPFAYLVVKGAVS